MGAPDDVADNVGIIGRGLGEDVDLRNQGVHVAWHRGADARLGQRDRSPQLLLVRERFALGEQGVEVGLVGSSSISAVSKSIYRT